MPRLRLFVAGLAVGLSSLAPSAGAQQPLVPLVSEWNNEALFDSTTTRAELLDMGRSAVTLSQFPLAEIYFQEALLRHPDDLDALCELAQLYKRTGRLEYARGLLTRAAALAPLRMDIAEGLRTVETTLRVGIRHEVDSLMTADRSAEALPRIAVLLSIAPDDVNALADKARCLAKIGQSDAALSVLDLALSKTPREDLHRLRAQIASRVEHEKVADLEASARRLIESGDWVREEATDVLQAILVQDPSNEWAREQFRALAGGASPPAPRPARVSWARETADALHDVAPGMVSFLDRHLASILIAAGLIILFSSPLARALARRVKSSSPFSGDLVHIDVTDVLRLANASALSGQLVLRTPEGRTKVFLEDGEPVHCTGFGMSGPEALVWAIAHVAEGTFELRPARGNVERTIEQPMAILLAGDTTAAVDAEAARRRRKSRMSELLGTHSE